MNLRISRMADRDIERIWKYIAADSPSAADRVEVELHRAMKLLAEHPGAGHSRLDVSDPRYRFWPVYSYVIAYRYTRRTLTVVRVIPGSRDFRIAIKRYLRSE